MNLEYLPVLDGDGIWNDQDNCPSIANPDQKNSDQDQNGQGDACRDPDRDHVLGKLDNCPQKYNPNQKDVDQDGLEDLCDDSDDRLTEKNNLLITAGVILAGLVLIFFLIRFLKRMKISEEEA